MEKRQFIGLAWLSQCETIADHRFYKIFRSEGYDPGFENPVSISYSAEVVPHSKHDNVWQWIATDCKYKWHWHHWGVFYAGHPGVIWTGNRDGVRKAVARLSQKRWGTLNWQYEEILHAPVRPKRGAQLGPYIDMVTTRSRHEMFRLRSRYPRAGALDWTPDEILRRQFGEGITFDGVGEGPEPRPEGVPVYD